MEVQGREERAGRERREVGQGRLFMIALVGSTVVIR
jgi:hypothetical protein